MRQRSGCAWLFVTKGVAMDSEVLIAYASKHGSTAEVAHAIAAELAVTGVTADVLEADDADDVSRYCAVVVGAPLYTGRWHRDALRFLRRKGATLQGMPVAVFALGPIKDEAAQFEGSRAQLDRALARLDWLDPVGVEVFGGAIDPAKLHFPFSHMPAADIRDWKAIRAWARTLPALLRLRVPVA
jgi:menaquinone-dependent protoporphyrinogen oxidase